MQRPSWKRVLRRVLMLILTPLLLAALLATLAATGVLSIPLLAGFSSLAIGGFVFMVAAGSGVGLSGLLWMMQQRLSKLTGRKAYGYVGVSFLIGFTFLSVGIVGFSLSLSSIGVFASLGAFGGPLAIGIICLGGSAIMVAMIAKLMEIMYKSKPSTQDKKQKKSLVGDKGGEEEMAQSSHSSPPMPLTAPPLPNIQEQKEGSPSSGSSWESIETIKPIIASRLPANPFKKIKLLPFNANFAEEWENDGSKLRDFFSSLCESTKALVMEFPAQKQYILEITEQSLKDCRNGLIGRYHSDRVGPEMGNKINNYSLFKCTGEELYAAILNYEQTEWNDRVAALSQSFREIAEDYVRIAATYKEIREINKETGEIHEKIGQDYQAILETYAQMGKDQERQRQEIDRKIAKAAEKLQEENDARGSMMTDAIENIDFEALKARIVLEVTEQLKETNPNMFFPAETCGDSGNKASEPSLETRFQ